MGVSSLNLKGLPPGFRFHPTDEELVCHYLKKKSSVSNLECGYLDIIKDVDLYGHEPSELPGMCSFRGGDREWFFFTQGAKKYPKGLRLNRATNGGFWKTTGRDQAVFSKGVTVGMKKTLVFYSGRAPRGQRTGWIMHEYRLSSDGDAALEKDSFVLCRVFLKNVPETKTKEEHRDSYQGEDSDSACYALATDNQQNDAVISPVVEPEIKDSNSPVERSIASSVEDCILLDDGLQQFLLECLKQPDKETVDIQAGDVPSNLFIEQFDPNAICTLNNEPSTWMDGDTIDLMHFDSPELWNFERVLSPGVFPGDFLELKDLISPLEGDSI